MTVVAAVIAAVIAAVAWAAFRKRLPVGGLRVPLLVRG